MILFISGYILPESLSTTKSNPRQFTSFFSNFQRNFRGGLYTHSSRVQFHINLFPVSSLNLRLDSSKDLYFNNTLIFLRFFLVLIIFDSKEIRRGRRARERKREHFSFSFFFLLLNTFPCFQPSYLANLFSTKKMILV